MTEQRTTVVNVRTDEYDIYIGRANNRRGLKQSDWANPFRIGRDGTRDEVIGKYRRYLRSNPALLARLPELQGKRLGCFCKPQECHGDVLAELANALDYRAPEATPERAPMTEERIAKLRRYTSQISTDDARDAFAEIERLVAITFGLNIILESTRDELTRLRAVIAERDAEIAKLNAESAEQLERFNTGWDHLHGSANMTLAEKNQEIERYEGWLNYIMASMSHNPFGHVSVSCVQALAGEAVPE